VPQQPLDPSAPPPLDLRITATSVSKQPRNRKMKWTQEAADDLRSLWGASPLAQPDNVLDLLKDAVVDPDYDPDDQNYKGIWRWPDGRIATPEEVEKYTGVEESLVSSMAEEMAAEVDREITRELQAAAPVPPPPILFHERLGFEVPKPPVHIYNAIELAPCSRWMKDVAHRIWGLNLG
jgi:hypothetical protein